MNTEHLFPHNTNDIARAGYLLRAGELVAVPTETVYGLAADASNAAAVAKIFAAKGRPADHPLIVHLAGLDQLTRWACEIPDWLPPVLTQLWPGPLTVILKKQPHVSDVITGGLPTVGLRVPNHPVLRDLLQQFDLAVAAPSANPYQQLSPTRAEHVLAGLRGKIAAVLDGGPCTLGTESTILRIDHDHAEVLRQGPLSAATLQELLPVPVHTPVRHQHAVSGNKKVHYRPRAHVQLLPSEALQQQWPQRHATTGKRVGALVYSAPLDGDTTAVLRVPPTHHDYRQRLYAALFELDQRGLDEIWVELPPQEPEWADIHDRLQRAAGSADERESATDQH
ncbi:threonylcarbamoyl-AMP synthase [Permianibacter sp. IMCC34836]|uniref:L-threonylcarbamoyladenylate synthase n=1 Tax=Permianibacter fluminis TaxID=2738515 RepID=UPI001553D3FC|nr:L-threonylcarbamoyladenylate synthase [Permianibacter fluminis]NQD36829.1 threonylcarbamoyl-AMP synthase [Permianibacter fluminis]